VKRRTADLLGIDMKKILIITRDVQTDSGVGRYSLEMARALVGAGYAPTLLVERGTSTAEASPGMVVHAVLLPPKSLVHILINLVVARWFSRTFTLVHSFEGWPFMAYAYGAVLFSQKRLYMTAHGTYAVAPLEYPMKKKVLTHAYRRAARIFCVSNYTEARLLEAIRLTNTTVIHSATSVLPVLEHQDEKELTQLYSIEGRYPIFLTVGQIKDRKGQLDTLKALCRLKEKYPDFLYVVVGAGPVKAYIESMRAYAAEQGVEKNLLIISDSRDDRVPAFFYERCDVFLLNANSDKGHFEGFGLVILEAAHYGKPSIGSKGSGIEDAIEDGYSGFLTGQKDYKGIAQRFEEVLSNYERFSDNARKFASNFTWEKTAIAYVKEYEA
jgi:phosphatidyl-myo-inositol dimannoside synthase